MVQKLSFDFKANYGQTMFPENGQHFGRLVIAFDELIPRFWYDWLFAPDFDAFKRGFGHTGKDSIETLPVPAWDSFFVRKSFKIAYDFQHFQVLCRISIQEIGQLRQRRFIQRKGNRDMGEAGEFREHDFFEMWILRNYQPWFQKKFPSSVVWEKIITYLCMSWSATEARKDSF